MKRLYAIGLALVLNGTFLNAGGGKVKIYSNIKDAYIYVDGTKKAMVGEGFTSMLLEEGEHTIRVSKPKGNYMEYTATKKVFIGEDTSTKLSFNLKLNSVIRVKKVWGKTFGTKKDRALNAIIQTNDGKFIAAGKKKDNGWIIRLDSKGEKLWEKNFDTKKDDTLTSVIQTKDGKFIAFGRSVQKDTYHIDGWIISLDSKGEKLWEKTFTYGSNSVIQTKNGGFITVGSLSSRNTFGTDSVVVKLDSNGNKLWEKVYPAKKDDELISIVQIKSGGFVSSGWVKSDDEKFGDGRLIKLTSNGEKIWEKIFKTKKHNLLAFVIQTKNGGFIVASQGDTLNDYYDCSITRLSSIGDRLWEKTFESKEQKYMIKSIAQTKDGGVIAVGGMSDTYEDNAWIVRLNNNGKKLWGKTFNYGSNGYYYLNSVIQTKDGEFIVAGNKFGKGWIVKLREE